MGTGNRSVRPLGSASIRPVSTPSSSSMAASLKPGDGVDDQRNPLLRGRRICRPTCCDCKKPFVDKATLLLICRWLSRNKNKHLLPWWQLTALKSVPRATSGRQSMNCRRLPAGSAYPTSVLRLRSMRRPAAVILASTLARYVSLQCLCPTSGLRLADSLRPSQSAGPGGVTPAKADGDATCARRSSRADRRAGRADRPWRRSAPPRSLRGGRWEWSRPAASRLPARRTRRQPTMR